MRLYQGFRSQQNFSRWIQTQPRFLQYYLPQLVNIPVSMISIVFVGLLFKEFIENFFIGNMALAGYMLLVTSAILGAAYFARGKNKNIFFLRAFIIGLAQAIAVIPGISRCQATIATSLLLGNKQEDAAMLSFLMVLVPIVADNVKDLMDHAGDVQVDMNGRITLMFGFVAAFVSGLVACKLMLRMVKKGKQGYFAMYCFIVGVLVILFW